MTAGFEHSSLPQVPPVEADLPPKRGSVVATIASIGAIVGVVVFGKCSSESPERPDYPAIDYSTDLPLPRPSRRPEIVIVPQASGAVRPETYDKECLEGLKKPSVTLDKAGCLVLEPYASDGSEDGKSTIILPQVPDGCGGRTVGYIDTSDGTPKHYTGGMPPGHEDAIVWAMKGDPTIERLLPRVGAVVFSLLDEPRHAAYYTEAREEGEVDAVQFCLQRGLDGSYPTRSVVRGTMRHELGHARHGDWKKLAESNPQIATLLEQYGNASLSELRLVSETARMSMQVRAVEVLTKVLAEYNPQNAAEEKQARIVQRVLDGFSRPHGLDELVAEKSADGQHSRANIHMLFSDESADMFTLAARELGIEYAYGSTFPRRDSVNEIRMTEKSGIKQLTEDFKDMIAAGYGHIDEGTVVPSFDRGGHPESKDTEWIASMFASIPTDPKAVYDAIRKLRPNHKKLVTQKLIIMQELISITDPGLENDMGLSAVIKALRTGKWNASPVSDIASTGYTAVNADIVYGSEGGQWSVVGRNPDDEFEAVHSLESRTSRVLALVA